MHNAHDSITRRSFVGTAAMGTGAVAATAFAPVSAHADGTAGGKETSATGGWTWPAAEPEITDISETHEADVVIVGCGLGGLATACSCAENGLSVIVIEQNETFSYRGAQYGSFNSTIWRNLGVELDISEVASNWIAQCNSRCNERLVYTFLNRSGEAMDWLADKVIEFGGTCFACGFGYVGAQYPEFKGTLIFYPPADNEDKALTYNNMPHNMFLKGAQEAGAEFMFETKAVQLLKNAEGRVNAVVATQGDAYVKFVANQAVVLATGDMSGNDEMCATLSPLMCRCTQRGYVPFGSNMGDGHIMAKQVGAKMEDGPYAPMIHPQGYSRLQGPNILLNVRGERFMNEDTWSQGRSVEILNQPGNVDYAWCIWSGDTDEWIDWMISTLPYGGGMFWDSNRVEYDPAIGGSNGSADWYRDMLSRYLDNGEWAWQVGSLAEAAEKMELDEEKLRSELEHYNSLVDAGYDSDFHKRPELLRRVETDSSQYTVYKVGPSRMVAPGGMLIDTRSRVLDEDSNPIEGLYAIGNCSGGLYAVDYPLVINGTSHGRCVTFGYLIGRELAGIE